MRKISYILISILSIFSQQLFAQLYIQGSATITCQNSPNIYIKGDLNNAGTINLSDADVYITENWTNTGNVSEGTSHVRFDGTANQSLTSGGDKFYDLTLNKSTAGTDVLTLSDNAEVSNTLTLTDGMINTTTSYKMDLGTTGTVAGETNGQFVKGELSATRTVNSSSSTFGGLGVTVDATANSQNLGTVAISRKAGTGVSGYSYLQNGPDFTLDMIVDVQAQNAASQPVALSLAWMSDWDNSVNISTVRGWNSTDGGLNWTTNGATYPGGTRNISFMDMNLKKWTVANDFACFATPPVADGGTNKTTCVAGSIMLTPTGIGTWSGGAGTFNGNEYTPNMSEAGTTVTLTWTVAGVAHCPNVSDNVDVVVNPIPPAPSLTASTDTACGGTIITLNATPSLGYTAVDYLWFKNGTAINSGTSSSYNVNVGSTSGNVNYSVEIAYTGYNCLSMNSATTSVLVMSPTATITPSGPTTFCANTPSTLNANGGMMNYTWKRGATTVQSGASPSYIPTASGNHNVTVADAYGCTKTSVWTGITIKAIPVANAGLDKNVCEGTSTQIGVASVAGNTYSWSPSLGLSNAAISNPIVTPTGNTNYTLTVYNTTSTCSNTDAVMISTLSAPISPSLSSTTTPVCQGANISMTPNSVGAASINWYKNGILLYNRPTNFVTTVNLPTAAADAYFIISKGANGCLSGASSTINAWVKEAAVPTFTSSPAAVGNLITVCVPGGTSGNAMLTASSTTPSPTYSWKLAGAYIAGANQANYTANVTLANNNKVMTVEATYPNGCVKTSLSKMVKLVTSGCTPKLGSDKDGADMLIGDSFNMSSYPNPTNGILNVEISNSDASMGKLVLYNTLGQTVIEKEIVLFEGKTNEQLDLSHVAKGVYNLSFQSNEEQFVEKVVKE